MSTADKKADAASSFKTDSDHDEGVRSHHSSIHEDEVEAPKFVPRAAADGNEATSGPLVMKRRMTLTKSQIQAASSVASAAQQDEEHNSLLDCFLCNNVMLEPRECSRCRKGFCKKCVNDYIDQLVVGDYKVICPSCSSPNMRLVDPHPLLTKQLTMIKAKCENADKGCTATISYADLEKHQQECDYLMVKCPNFGCDAEMFQKDFERHEATCEFRVIRCDKCDVVKIPEEEHDCVKSMAMKYEHLEGKLIQVSQRLELELERAERNRLDEAKGTQLVRMDIGLPALSQIKFNAQYGWQQMIAESVIGLPQNTRTVILRFGLTDMNMRRDYDSLCVSQEGSPAKIDLTNHFFVGPEPLPAFGQMVEVIMPWDQNLEAKLVVEFTVAAKQQAPPHYPPPHHHPYGPPHGGPHHQQHPYGGPPGSPYGPPPGSYGAPPTYGGYHHHQPPPPHHMHGQNPFAYATISIGGFHFKQ